MPLLALDTATDSPVVALVGDDGELLRGATIDGRAQVLLSQIDELLVGLDRTTIMAVVVGVGPGGFTGLRVGVSTARGIAETLRVPLHGVSSMFAAAHALTPGGDPAVIAIDARRGECFTQMLRIDHEGEYVAVGAVHAQPRGAYDGELAVVTPEGLARAAAWRRALAIRDGDVGDPLAVVPRYGREPDATPPRIDVRVDQLRDDDLDALLMLEERCFPTPWTRAMYAGELYRPPRDRVLLAARDTGAGDRLVGAALAARIGDCWHVMNVLVDPIARRRGIADRLMRELLDRSAALDPEEGWTLEVRDDNDAAIKLYERLGFVNRGCRRGYYADTGQDALVMWRAPDAVTSTTPDAVEAKR